MIVYVQQKSLGKKLRALESRPVELEPVPGTLRELVETLVRREAADHTRRVRDGSENRPRSGAQIDEMGETGKIAFGRPYDHREAEPDAAVKTAMEAVEDGLVRIFLNDREVEMPDAPLELREGDQITILRLTMLTGGFF